MEDLNNPELQAEYAINRRHILAGDEDSNLKKVYNFPSNNLHRGFNEIRGHLTQIYYDQENAFRINFSFGMILQNTETGEYRYYIPCFNNKILHFPFTISNRNSIRFLMFKLAKLDIIEQARAVRSSTAWTLAFITNIQYVVFKTQFPLGQVDHFPLFLKKILTSFPFILIELLANHIKIICAFLDVYIIILKINKVIQYCNTSINGEDITIVQKF